MKTEHAHQLILDEGTIAYDDTGGDGPLVVMLPGAGDTREEYRFLAPLLRSSGARTVTADLRGHGDSSSEWPSFGMAETASDLVALLEHLDAGPATVVATSFAPAAALWAAADRRDLLAGLVLVSAHLEAPPAWQGAALKLALRGPFAAKLWAGQYRKWHPGAPPADLAEQCDRLRSMVARPDRRRAVRDTLTAHRNGLDERIATLDLPTLTIMGGADDHFDDPSEVARSIATRLGGTHRVIADAGHYPHAEYPAAVAEHIAEFMGR